MDTKQKASLFAIASALVLAVSKFSVGMMSGSMAVTSSGLDSLLDVFMSAMNFAAIRKAEKPADDTHHYGHGKVEDMAAVVQSLVIVFTGGAIIYQAVHQYFAHQPVVYSTWDLPVMFLSLVFSFFISHVLKRVGDKTESNALKADALHYASDLYSNSGAIVAIILTYYTGKSFFDLLFAVAIGCIILFSALRILKGGLSGLMDTRIPEQMEQEIADVVDNMPYPFAGYHKLRTRSSGSKKYVDFHLLTCRKLTIEEAHGLASQVEQEIKRRITTVDLTIHVEPCAYTCELNELTCSVLKVRAQRRASIA
ncbi:MAG: cation diffusion facilitator family transporter [Deltaproteobacteria bacterium]|jgi:cation diffusion facilitator family transporter|nr:cation diffusion facilitator family transporter [Deltaproteobacteria bacterium]